MMTEVIMDWLPRLLVILGLVLGCIGGWIFFSRFDTFMHSKVSEPSAPTEYSLPIRGRDSTGKIYHGQSTFRPNGKGDFWIETIDGLRCEGEYNSLDQSAAIKVEAKCSDGRTGHAIIARSLRDDHGVAIAKFSDGVTAEFSFGGPAVWVNIPAQSFSQ